MMHLDMNGTDLDTLAARLLADLDDARACLLGSADGNMTSVAVAPVEQARAARAVWSRLRALGAPTRGFLVVEDEMWAFVSKGSGVGLVVASPSATPGLLLDRLEMTLQTAESVLVDQIPALSMNGAGGVEASPGVAPSPGVDTSPAEGSPLAVDGDSLEAVALEVSETEQSWQEEAPVGSTPRPDTSSAPVEAPAEHEASPAADPAAEQAAAEPQDGPPKPQRPSGLSNPDVDHAALQREFAFLVSDRVERDGEG